jgi:hypothetical protein
MKWVGHLAHIEQVRIVERVFAGKPDRKRILGQVPQHLLGIVKK